MIIRCSALPRIMSCPASIKTPKMVIDQTSDAAIMGVCVHEIMAEIVAKQLDVMVNLEPYNLKYPDLNHKELKMLAYNGLDIWKKLKDNFKLVSVEKEYGQNLAVTGDGVRVDLVGHPDLVGITDDDQLVIPDWKSGRFEGDFAHQQKGYAFVANMVEFFESTRDVKSIALVSCWLRSGAHDVQIITMGALKAWFEEFREVYVQYVETPESLKYNPQPNNCRFCPQKYDCPSKTTMVKAGINEWADGSFKDYSIEKLASSYPKYQMVKRAMEEYDLTIRSHIKKTEKPLPIGDGNELYFHESEVESITPGEETFCVLGKFFDTNYDGVLSIIEPALKITKGALNKIITEYSENRQGRANIAAIMFDLEGEGMIETTKHFQLKQRKVVEDDKA